MKTKLKLLIAALCGIFVTTAVFGQNTYVWTNNLPGDISGPTNWIDVVTGANGFPTTAADTMKFDGQSTGPVIATANLGVPNQQNNQGFPSMCTWVTGNQTQPVFLCVTLANALAPYSRWGGPVQIDSGAGTFNIGNDSTTNAIQYEVGTANGQIHTFTNNSANPAIIWPNVAIRAGGGGSHTFDFGGTGNWYVTNDLKFNNGAGSVVQVEGPGTLVWTAGHNSYSIGNSGVPASPLNINGGTVILRSPGLFVSTVGSAINNNGTLLEWDLGAQSQSYPGNITGTGVLQVASGTLTLGAGSSGGVNTFTGNVVLSGGELIVNSAENLGTSGPLGVGGTITFTGGTLGFSSINTYDYSPRFSTAASQAYSFDTGGQNVTLTNALTSSGGTLTRLGSGTLTVAGANTYSGATTVSAGKLEIQGSQANGSITVADSATLGVTETGPQITPATLTMGTTASAILEFNNVSSTTTAPLAVTGTVSAGGAITINVASGSFIINQSYPLFSFSGTPPAVTLNQLTGAGGNLSTNGNTIQLNITSLAFVWSGLNNDNWDISTLNNWKVNGVAQIFANGGTALFDDTVTTANTNITLNSAVSPASVTVNNNAKPYSIASSGANLIAGIGGLTKNGNSTLALSGGVNTYSGATTISGGTLIVGALANGGSPSDIGQAANSAAKLVLNGGTLQYTGGGAASDHLFTLGTAGGTIDNEGGGQLNLTSSGAVAFSGTGARTLSLTGIGTSGDTLAAVLGDNGGATALTKNGAGTWILTGNNTNSGTVTINQGTLQVGAGGSGALGSGNITDQGVLDFNIAGTVTNGIISGSGSVIVDGSSKVVLPGNNGYTGGTTINPSATLQVGTGGAIGSLKNDAPIDDEGLLIFNTTGSFIYSAAITGSGNVIVRGVGNNIGASGNNTYTGWTVIDPGATFEPINGLSGQLASSLITNNGTLLCPIQGDPGNHIITGPIVGSGELVIDAATTLAPGDLNLNADCTYTGGTIIRQNNLIVGDGGVSGSIVGDVVFTNSAYGYEFLSRSLHFYRSDNITFAGNITGPGGTLVGGSVGSAGTVVQDGGGTLTLTGNNTYLGGTTINAGTVQVGNGGTSGSIGSGPVTDGGILIWNRSDAVSFDGVISGGGALVQFGPGTLTLTATNTYSGQTTVSNGTLVINATVPGDMVVNGGTFVPGGVSVGADPFAIAGNWFINAGTVVVSLNKALSPAATNTTITVGGAITYAGGTLKVVNAGPALVVGDTFPIFPVAIPALASMPITALGFTVANHLGVDGTIQVTSVAPSPSIGVTNSGGQVVLSWPVAWKGLHLQSQTNTLAVGLKTNWVTIAGTDAANGYTNTPSKGSGVVFYRLAP